MGSDVARRSGADRMTDAGLSDRCAGPGPGRRTRRQERDAQPHGPSSPGVRSSSSSSGSSPWWSCALTTPRPRPGSSTGPRPPRASSATFPASPSRDLRHGRRDLARGRPVPPVLMHGQPPLSADGKPEVLYVGAEYCPFCAAERWPLIVALSRFGTFTGLHNMQSSSTSVFPEIQSFSFVGATYPSPYVAFTGIEEYSDVPGIDGTFTRIAFPTAAAAGHPRPLRSDRRARLDGAIRRGPLSVRRRGQQGRDRDLAVQPGRHRGAVPGGDRRPPRRSHRPVATKAVVASANYLTAAICLATDQQPPKLCASKGVRAAAASLTAS